jgi:hypothetical protein
MDIGAGSAILSEFITKEGPFQFGADAKIFYHLVKAPHDGKAIAGMIEDGTALAAIEAVQRALPIIISMLKDKNGAANLVAFLETL